MRVCVCACVCTRQEIHREMEDSKRDRETLRASEQDILRESVCVRERDRQTDRETERVGERDGAIWRGLFT